MKSTSTDPLPNSERHKVLIDWNQTQADFPIRSLPELFLEQVAKTPNITAIKSNTESLTYKALNERANQFAHYLQAHGVKSESHVAICLDRSLELIIAILGVLKAGGAYVPLDPAYPENRLSFMLHDSNAVTLITNNELSHKLPEFSGHYINIDMDLLDIQQQSTTNPTDLVQAHNLAYIIYTSGSTGQPKGVMVEHYGWASYVRSAQQTYQLKPGDQVLQFASISWDTSAEEIFPCLTSGATLVLRTDDMSDSIPRFLENCNKWEVNVINIPTAFWHEMVTQLSNENLILPHSLRVVIIGGERAHLETLSKWREHSPSHIHLFNTYGQTECTAITTCVELIPASTIDAIPLGKPVHNVCAYILDENLSPVPVGQPGELYVGGSGLARGYLNQPELTAKKFVANPFGASGEKLYKTGDLVRYWPDGNLEFVGRVDHQLKIRGIRIEPGEIESALLQNSTVQTAVVVGYPIGTNPEYLAAYVVMDTLHSTTPTELRQWLRERLPGYLVPAIIIPLDALPLTPNGKLDRGALPTPDFSNRSMDTDTDEPMTDIQSVLGSIWQDVLGLKSVGLHDNFFEIGGHSLLATRVVARVRQHYNIDLSIRTMFNSPTIARLSEQIQLSTPITNEPKLVKRQPSEPLIASFAQESLWFLDQMAPGNPTYNIFDALRISGPLNVSMLERSLNTLVQRHEVLRTRFAKVNGQPVPVIAPILILPLPVIEVPPLSESEQMNFVRRFGAEEAVKPFNLETGPLLRVTLACLNSTSYVLIVVTHHIISDGWSIAIFFQELSTLYEAYSRNMEDALLELPFQFSDYAIWQRQYLQGERLELHLNYWKEKLNNISPYNFPLDHPRLAQRSFRGARLPISFDSEFTARLNSFSHTEEATLFMVLLTAFQTVISRYTSQTDITVGTAVANRHQPELDNLLGFFVNTLVLRNDLSGNPTFRELLQRVKETTLNAYQHQAAPFEVIVQSLHPQRAANRNPLFDAMLFLQNVQAPQVNLPSLETSFIELEQTTSEFDFVFDFTETPDGLKGFCEYDIDLFDTSTMLRFINHFQTFLHNAVLAPEEKIAVLPLLSPNEEQQLIVEWNHTSQQLDSSTTIPDLFELQASITPDQIAIFHNSKQITFNKLNEVANQLAHYLLLKGVEKESVVGICLDRSIESIIAILGILKIGAAYLPLDPAYPLERLNYMLSDSQSTLLITDTHHQLNFERFSGHLIAIDTDASILADQPTSNPPRDLNGENACYVIYTSGSTGNPKGVVGLHRAAINRFQWMWEAYPFVLGDVCSQKTALSFVDSVWEMFGPLLHGVPLVIIPDTDLKDTRRFVDTLAQHHVTRIVLVPSLLRLMFETHPNLETRLPDLRLWVCSGEALTQELADEFLKKLPGRILLNLYGSSEVAADSTYYEINRLGSPVYIGRPINNTEVYIIDENLVPVPVGVTGEIYIGGMGLARGYWQRPDLTAERFIAHPFRNEPNSRLYKTGDLGRYKPDGNIEYLGRTDFQVKIRGFRVELAEIQNVLLQHSAINQALVTTRVLSDGPQLVAYIVAHTNVILDPLELRSFSEKLLPDYMIPSTWVFLDKFPLTPSGKIDRNSLPSPTSNHIEAQQSFIAPRDELELRLAKLWEQLLEHAPIGINDNFFEVGGHSMLVVRLITKLEKEFDKSLSLALIFHAPTIAQMASVLRDQGWKPTWSSLVPIRSHGNLPPLFCVHADGGAFFYTRFADYLSPEQPFYGLQARGLDGAEPPFTSVEDMAKHYLKEIRSIQPHGPYIIGGFSMGGVVIYEMAQQLVSNGEDAPLLIFIDAPSPSYFAEEDKSVMGKLTKLTHLTLQSRIQTIRVRLGQRYRWLKDNILINIYLLFNRPLTPTLRIHHVRETNRFISDKYEPKPYSGKITVLHASEQIRRISPDPTLGWGQYVSGKISDHIVPGNHETILHEPNVQVLAKTLQTCIDHALSDRS